MIIDCLLGLLQHYLFLKELCHILFLERNEGLLVMAPALIVGLGSYVLGHVGE